MEILENLLPFLTAFSLSLMFYALLRLLAVRDIKWLRRLFYVPARKSDTNAVQLGGLPFSIGAYGGLYLTGLYKNTLIYDLSVSWFFASSLIVIYGYLDDKFELRPTVKLGFQFFSVILYSLLASFELASYYQAFFFVILFLWSFGSLNGSNLLDGLDTLSIKLATSNFILVGCIFYFTTDLVVIQVCSVFVGGLAAFYLFNKEPSTIHMGEIGGSFLGSSYVFLSTLIFSLLTDDYSIWEKIAYSLLPLNLPMVESGVSFLRRIYNKKSPFTGDKLHIHHILKNQFKFSASHSSSILALGYIGTLLLALPLLISHPFLGYIGHITIMIGCYLAVGVKYWRGEDTISINPKEIFNSLRKKDIMIIESGHIDEFKITILSNSPENEAEDSDQDHELQEFEDKDIDKEIA